MKKVLAATVALFFGLGCFAQGHKPFRVELNLPKTDYVLGEPVWCNEVFFHAPMTPQGAMDWEAVHVKGLVRTACHTEKRLVEQGMLIGKPEPGPAEFTRTFLLSDSGIVDTGEYELWTEYPADMYFNRVYAPTPVASLVRSNTIHVRIVAPTGIDAEIFDAHHDACNKVVLSPQNLLEKFATSTYAAYVVYNRMAEFARQDAGAVSGVIEGGHFNSNSYPDDTGKSKDGWRSMEGKEAADWWAKWYDIILKNHPNIWFADELRLKRAVDQLALKNYQAGAADLEVLSKEAKPDVGGKAKQYLTLMKQKGWVKDSSTPPAQPAPAAPAKDK